MLFREKKIQPRGLTYISVLIHHHIMLAIPSKHQDYYHLHLPLYFHSGPAHRYLLPGLCRMCSSICPGPLSSVPNTATEVMLLKPVHVIPLFQWDK